MTTDDLLKAARRLDGKILRTVRGREFKVGIFRDCPFFIPASTMLGRSDGRKAMETSWSDSMYWGALDRPIIGE